MVEVIEVGVLVVVCQELLVRAGFGDAAVFDVDDLIGVGDGEQVMGNDDGGAPGDEPA